MNWAEYKDPVTHMCLAGAVVASWCLTQEVASSSPFDDKHVLETFREKYQAILPIPPIKY